MSRNPAERRRNLQARRARTLRGFVPSIQPLEMRQLMAGQLSAGWVPPAYGLGSGQVYTASSLETSTSASYVNSDWTTKGNWIGSYGADGYSLAGDDDLPPSYATVTMPGAQVWTWGSGTTVTETRALQRPNDPGRVVACWYHPSDFSINIDVAASGSEVHRISLYLLDGDGVDRTTRVEVIDPATGAVLDDRSVTDFHEGVYLTWDVRGAVRFRVINNGGANAAVSGVFFDQVPASASATYVGSDPTTKGDWIGAYGGDGYSLAGGWDSQPGYATVSFNNKLDYVWDSNVVAGETRAVQKPDGSGRVAAAWFNSSPFEVVVDVTPSDDATHRISLYLLDWDGTARITRIEVVDPETGAALDSRESLQFHDGLFQTWDVRGSVQFRITRVGGANAAISGIFFDQVPGTSAVPATPTGVLASTVSDSAVQLTWTASAGAVGYAIERSVDGTSWLPLDTTVGANATSYTDSNLSEGTRYHYRVAATNASGTSTSSGPQSAWTRLKAPTGLAAALVSASSVGLAWVDVAGMETGYVVERSSDGMNWGEPITTPANATNVTLTGAFSSTTYFRVRAVGSDGRISDWSAPVTWSPVVVAPTNLSATRASADTIDLVWTGASGTGQSFEMQRSTDNGSTWTPTSLGTDQTSYSATGLTPYFTYLFRIHASNAAGGSAYSNAVSIYMNPDASNAPANLNAIALDKDRIALSWTDFASGELGYKLERSDPVAGWIVIDIPADTTTYVDRDLAEYKSYSYRIRSYDAAGYSSYSSTVQARTLLARPSDFVATFVSPTRVDLSWTDRSELDDTGYRAEQSLNGVTDWNFSGGAGQNDTSTSVGGLFLPGVTYYFRILTVHFVVGGAHVVSEYATTALTIPLYPTTPSGVVASNAGPSIDLSWSDSSGEAGYKIERHAEGALVWTYVDSVGANVTSYRDSKNLAEITRYYYRVTAYNAGGSSNPSDMTPSSSALTSPAAPDGLRATFVSPGRIDLAWYDRSAVESSYLVELSRDGGVTWTPANANANATSYPMYGTFDRGETYYFRVSANWGGRLSLPSTTTVTPAFPAQPLNVNAAGVSETSILVSWAAVSGAVGYRVERTTTPGTGWVQVPGAVVSGTNWTDTGISSDSVSYYYRIVAYNAAGDSSYSSSTAPTRTQLRAPSALSIVSVSPDEIRLTWTDRSSREVGYKIQLAVGESGAWQEVKTVAANATSFTVAGPIEGLTTYRFRVWAYDNVADSALSEASVATAFPAWPKDLAFTYLSSSAVGLAWTPAADATEYRVYRRTKTGSWADIGGAPSDLTLYNDATVVAGTTYYYAVAAKRQNLLSALSVVGPALARDGAADEDGDGLSNIDEANLGTDPTYFDTDGDLLPDGWETRYEGFDPKNPTPAQGDADGDGLTNLAEYTHDTDPTSGDTDGDGVSDSAEVASGADPKDPSDGGVAPADDMKGEFRLTTGDPSGSMSERWELQVGDIKYQSPGYGQVGSGNYFFDAGESYEIRMRHIGTRPDFLAQYGAANYDWTASITRIGTSSLPYWIDDSGQLLREHIEWPPGLPNQTEGKVSYLHIPQLDVDVDSDNDNQGVDVNNPGQGFALPGRTKEEDRLESDSEIGKMVWVDNGDLDEDHVPDFADFDGIVGGRFVPMVVSLSSNVQYAQPSSIKFKFTYSSSTPEELELRSDGTYELPAGKLRIWLKDATSVRSITTDFIDSGEEITAEQLGIAPGGSVTLYVEAVSTDETKIESIVVTASVIGAKWSGSLSDTVHVAIFDPYTEVPEAVSADAHKAVPVLVLEGLAGEQNLLNEYLQGASVSFQLQKRNGGGWVDVDVAKYHSLNSGAAGIAFTTDTTAGTEYRMQIGIGGYKVTTSVMTVVAGQPHQLELVSAPASVPADGVSPISISVRVRDQYGNLMPDDTPVEFRVDRSNATTDGSGTGVALTVNGIASFEMIAGTLSAAVPSQVVRIRAGAAESDLVIGLDGMVLSVVDKPTSIVAGDPTISPTVTVQTNAGPGAHVYFVFSNGAEASATVGADGRATVAVPVGNAFQANLKPGKLYMLVSCAGRTISDFIQVLNVPGYAEKYSVSYTRPVMVSKPSGPDSDASYQTPNIQNPIPGTTLPAPTNHQAVEYQSNLQVGELKLTAAPGTWFNVSFTNASDYDVAELSFPDAAIGSFTTPGGYMARVSNSGVLTIQATSLTNRDSNGDLLPLFRTLPISVYHYNSVTDLPLNVFDSKSTESFNLITRQPSVDAVKKDGLVFSYTYDVVLSFLGGDPESFAGIASNIAGGMLIVGDVGSILKNLWRVAGFSDKPVDRRELFLTSLGLLTELLPAVGEVPDGIITTGRAIVLYLSTEPLADILVDVLGDLLWEGNELTDPVSEDEALGYDDQDWSEVSEFGDDQGVGGFSAGFTATMFAAPSSSWLVKLKNLFANITQDADTLKTAGKLIRSKRGFTAAMKLSDDLGQGADDLWRGLKNAIGSAKTAVKNANPNITDEAADALAESYAKDLLEVLVNLPAVRGATGGMVRRALAQLAADGKLESALADFATLVVNSKLDAASLTKIFNSLPGNTFANWPLGDMLKDMASISRVPGFDTAFRMMVTRPSVLANAGKVYPQKLGRLYEFHVAANLQRDGYVIERLDVKIPKPGTNLVDTDIDVVTRKNGQLIYWQVKRTAGAFKSEAHVSSWIEKARVLAQSDSAKLLFATRPEELGKIKPKIFQTIERYLGEDSIVGVPGL